VFGGSFLFFGHSWVFTGLSFSAARLPSFYVSSSKTIRFFVLVAILVRFCKMVSPKNSEVFFSISSPTFPMFIPSYSSG